MNRVFLHKITILACLLLLITSSIGSDKGFQTPEQYAQIIQEHFANVFITIEQPKLIRNIRV